MMVMHGGLKKTTAATVRFTCVYKCAKITADPS